MVVSLSISSPELSDDRVQNLTLDLCRTITRETDIAAELPRDIAGRGTKGEPITLGLIVLTILKGGSAVAFLNVLKSYFDREPSIKMKIKREDGTEVVIDAKNMQPDKIKDIIEAAK